MNVSPPFRREEAVDRQVDSHGRHQRAQVGRTANHIPDYKNLITSYNALKGIK